MTPSETFGSIALGCLVLASAYFLGQHEGYQDGLTECSVASAKSEAIALAAVAQNYRRQMAEQRSAVAKVQAQKTALGAALVAAQTHIERVVVRQDCSVGPDAITAMNLVRGERP